MAKKNNSMRKKNTGKFYNSPPLPEEKKIKKIKEKKPAQTEPLPNSTDTTYNDS